MSGYIHVMLLPFLRPSKTDVYRAPPSHRSSPIPSPPATLDYIDDLGEKKRISKIGVNMFFSAKNGGKQKYIG